MSRLAVAFLLFSLAPFLASAPPVAAQEVPSLGLTSPLENPNRFARPGVPTNEVWVWGEVSQPGIWRVERGVDLVQFLSHLRVVGVGQEQAERVRRFTVKIYRGQPRDRSLIYEVRLDELLEQGGDYPDLEEGDILAVEVEERRTRLRIFRTVVGAIGSGASLALLFLRIFDRQ